MAQKILIVDDARDLVESLAYSLGQAGYLTRAAFDGAQALAAAREEPAPDLVLLDLNLPEISGTGVCRELRRDPATRHIPIIMLTARAAETDRIVGFEVGADDYVVKPFSTRELLLRIQAVLRRAAPASPAGDILDAGCLRIDVPAHRVFVDDGEVSLTALEFKLLHTFVSRRGRVQTRDILLDDVWDVQADITTRTVDTNVKRLREKLGAAGTYIETLRGVGYRFDVPEAG